MQTKILNLILMIMSISSLYASDSKSWYISGGIGFGSTLAISISWSQNQSVLWAILHGIFGWLYVCYFVIKRNWS